MMHETSSFGLKVVQFDSFCLSLFIWIEYNRLLKRSAVSQSLLGAAIWKEKGCIKRANQARSACYNCCAVHVLATLLKSRYRHFWSC